MLNIILNPMKLRALGYKYHILCNCGGIHVFILFFPLKLNIIIITAYTNIIVSPFILTIYPFEI